MTEILKVTPEGEFIWHEDADRLIEESDFTNSPSMPHILRALRRAQPEQEPVARLHITETDTYPDVDVEVLDGAMLQPSMSPVNVYTAPPQRKPLTEEQIIEATEHIDTSCHGYFVHITRAIEAAHGIKETS